MTRTELINDVKNLYNNHKNNMYESRLNHCTAWVYEIGNIVLLRSYNTIVAVYFRTHSTLYVFDYYSATTSQHVSKFIRLVNPTYVDYLYRRSDRVIERMYSATGNSEWKLKKSEYELLEIYDFSQLIISAEKANIR